MPQGDAERKSTEAFMDGAKKIRKAVNETWKRAPKAPMFTRKPNPNAKQRLHPKTGKPMKIVYTNRLITGHAYNIAASGAAVAAMGIMSREAKALRLNIEKESPNTPWLPRYSKGAKALLEQFLCAYGQEAFSNAVNMKNSLDTHKRVTSKMLAIGFERAHNSVFKSVTPPCATVCVAPYTKPPKVDKDGKKKTSNDDDDEKEYDPKNAEQEADDDDQVEDNADDEQE